MRYSICRKMIAVGVAIGILFICTHFGFSQESTESPPAAPKITVELDGQPTLPSPGSVTGTWFFARQEGTGPQLLLLGFPKSGSGEPFWRMVAALRSGEKITLRASAGGVADFSLWDRTSPPENTATFGTDSDGGAWMELAIPSEATSRDVVWIGETSRLNLDPQRPPMTREPTAQTSELRTGIAEALIEWDWRTQDGIGTPNEPRTFAQAVPERLQQGDALLRELASHTEFAPETIAKIAELQTRWDSLRQRSQTLSNTVVITGGGKARTPPEAESAWESLWLELHRLRREIVLTNPLFANVGPIVFVKHTPSIMSHQLTQCYGYTARPGGGLFVLEAPGRSMAIRNITPPELPVGSFMQTDLSPEVVADPWQKKILFAFAEAPDSPESWKIPESVLSRYYHVYEMNADGTGLRQLTDGDFNDFAPIYTPDGAGNGKITFISTRRGGYHRCGGGPCFVYTLAQMDRDGTNVRVLSFHETNEWDPAVLDDGRLVYTRWDYVDRNAVYYQNLWSTRFDGTDTRIFFGNNTLNPCGIWQSRAVPGSSKVMAIAGPHHGLSAGSVILLDTRRGVDGPEPIERLTPEILFPEAEAPLAGTAMPPAVTQFDTEPPSWWDGRNPPGPAEHAAFMPVEQLRWPGHCCTTPYPLSEQFLIVSYSYDRLRGEAGPNIPNMFGIYFADRFGNRELVYRDPRITSQWAKPLQTARREIFDRPAASVIDAKLAAEDRGTLLMQNVYESWPKLPAGEKITRLRILQILPKTTPNANQPMVGAANASPGKQVLGTVPVESDGSAYFELPAKTLVSFVALNDKGRAVQIMRSAHYLQPGETGSCIGCHEKRSSTPPAVRSDILAAARDPSPITPGPDGSRPFSYPILVQPVLDAQCISCHTAQPTDPAGNGGVILTGDADGTYTKSYNALVGLGAYTAWGLENGNYEPLSEPGRFASGGAKLVKMLDAGHYGVTLSDEEWERICTWLDANALFYGTFNPEEQAKQQRGERIAGPDLVLRTTNIHRLH